MIDALYNNFPFSSCKAFASSAASSAVSYVKQHAKIIATIGAVAFAIFACYQCITRCKHRSRRFRQNISPQPWQFFSGVLNASSTRGWRKFSDLPQPTQLLSIESKKELIEKAIAYFGELDEDAQKTSEWQVVAEKVNDYFLDALQQLERGVNIPIPMYYHASRNAADLIAKDANLKSSSHGVQGPGTYFSTNDEFINSYGPVTFAFDPSLVEKKDFKVTYESLVGSGLSKTPWDEDPLWMCATNSDISFTDRTQVAYVIVPDGQEQATIDKYWGDEKTGFYVPVVSRSVADQIRRVLRAVHVHRLPSHWKPFVVSRPIRLKCFVA